ncbi:MAG: hypothetical protein EON89_14530 [Brevundimonas sp.]|nr:MAG: hypothetical protein EON89_14530 [Brevundimonas sp.]
MTRRIWLAAAILFMAVGLWLAAAVLFLPGLLFFPHHRLVGDTPVYASAPITPGMEQVLRRADARLRASPLYRPEVSRSAVYLTDGGVRWRILSLGSGQATALTRGYLDGVVVRRASIEYDFVWNGRGRSSRTLSGVIAHEKTHILIRDQFGAAANVTGPRWLIEGYCDHVAGESTLSEKQAARMVAAGRTSPALFYFQARKRVEAALAANGGSVEALFETRSPTG